eukprot:CAMPEP_0113944186 /NCGR_PEP_ID=MMETSP1339-20121228/30990_1 /TAXON_ID=94617 /ORGANISM="Fibrocapsa japonica" /LENGTH=397 /DNA_ID=CAMNT_0000949277 /DNA_START=265 /DNA_END=1458 /DNA_ORIENTATION=+ /assembly_acc=CAM_ASM_000762
MDYYDDLGVTRSASEKDIKTAYRKAARKWHPDVNKDPGADAKFREITSAYEILSDPEMRQRYDQFGEAGVKGGAGGYGGGPGGAGFEVDLGDIFDTFFGGGGGAQGFSGGDPFGGGFGGGSPFGGGASTRSRTRGPAKGDDLQVTVDVDFQTACFGGEEKVNIRHLETCTTCDGDGVKPGAKIETCSTCGGQGVVTQVTQTPFGQFQSRGVCPTCNGEGKTVSEYCGTCSGQGVVEKSKQVKVKIPCGVNEGNRLRVRNEGDAGLKGGPAGDLYVALRIKNDPKFKREGTDIYSDVKLSYLDAILGNEKMEVEMIDGKVDIKVPSGCQPGTVLRVRNKGAPNLNKPEVRGDHYVTVKVEIPKKLSGREKELIEELQSLREGAAAGGFGGIFGGKGKK